MLVVFMFLHVVVRVRTYVRTLKGREHVVSVGDSHCNGNEAANATLIAQYVLVVVRTRSVDERTRTKLSVVPSYSDWLLFMCVYCL